MRIKRGQNKKAKHKKVLSLTKGYRLSYSKLYRRAREAMLHAGQYSFAHRKRRRSQKRQEWIKTISAALSTKNMSYSRFIHSAKEKNVIIDRKNIAEMIVNNPAHFDKLVEALD